MQDIPDAGGVETKAEVSPSTPTPSNEAKELRLRPHEWAERLGLVKQADERVRKAVASAAAPSGAARPQLTRASHWKHAAADKLFGWSDHAYHFEQGEQTPEQAKKSPRFTLTEKQYREALEAAARYPAGKLPAFAVPKSHEARIQLHRPRRHTRDRGPVEPVDKDAPRQENV